MRCEALALWLAACSGAATEAPPGSPTLTVTGGFGGGTFAAGSEVHVWADVNPQTQIASFTGDVDVLAQADEWNSPLVMPDRDVALEVKLETVDAPVQERTLALATGDRRVLVVTRDAPVGGVVFFHGAAYSVDQLNDNAARTLVLHLVRAGWAVAALASTAEASAGTGGWTSADLPNAEALIAALRVDGTFPAAGPVVAWGMSSGGQFAHSVGAAGLVDAVVAYCAPGTAADLAATSTPTAWYLAAEDTTFPNVLADSASWQQDLEGRGVRTDRYVHPVTPLYDQRFTRVAGIDEATSAIIAAGGVAAAPQLTPEQVTAVNAELEIVAAVHELYDDAAARTLRFLEQR